MLQNPNGGLRLSDSSTMNDPEEGFASADGRELYNRMVKEFEPNSWIRRRYEASHICCFVGGDMRDQDEPINVSDDLLFWRLYGGDCRGLSITIPANVSDSLLKTSKVQKVSYANDSS